MTREDIECIIKWFSHIEQLATDGKTANGFQMPPDKILATIKVIAKDSREYVEKFCDESTPNDLEEAADEYLQKVKAGFLRTLEHPTAKDCFKDGAKWQAEQDKETIELAEDHAYLAGSVNEREKMMKEAVEGVVFGNVYEHWVETRIEEKLSYLNPGDKVRVIVLKKED